MWAQRGHKGCTSASTDARVDGTVRARVRHVIDKKGGGGRGRGTVCVAASEGRMSIVQ